jgi:hypothetical protein
MMFLGKLTMPLRDIPQWFVDQVVKPYSRAKRLMWNVWTHDRSEMLFARRKAYAMTRGQDPEEVEPFPQVKQQSSYSYRTGSPWDFIKGAVLLAAGAGGALGVSHYAGQLPQRPVIEKTEEITKKMEPQKYRVDSCKGQPRITQETGNAYLFLIGVVVFLFSGIFPGGFSPAGRQPYRSHVGGTCGDQSDLSDPCGISAEGREL